MYAKDSKDLKKKVNKKLKIWQKKNNNNDKKRKTHHRIHKDKGNSMI